MVDKDGFRANVGMILVNKQGMVFWGRRYRNSTSWQFPQGGIKHKESVITALYRELFEEVGLRSADVVILAGTIGWLRYYIPKQYVRVDNKDVCIGQKQKWFLLSLMNSDAAINLTTSRSQEFVEWCWVPYWYSLSRIVNFKRDVYRSALTELYPVYKKYLTQS